MSDEGVGCNIGIFGLIWIILIILKAMGYLTWGWIPVLFFPLWFPFALILAIIAIVLGFLLAIAFILFIVVLILKILGVDIS